MATGITYKYKKDADEQANLWRQDGFIAYIRKTADGWRAYKGAQSRERVYDQPVQEANEEMRARAASARDEGTYGQMVTPEELERLGREATSGEPSGTEQERTRRQKVREAAYPKVIYSKRGTGYTAGNEEDEARIRSFTEADNAKYDKKLEDAVYPKRMTAVNGKMFTVNNKAEEIAATREIQNIKAKDESHEIKGKKIAGFVQKYVKPEDAIKSANVGNVRSGMEQAGMVGDNTEKALDVIAGAPDTQPKIAIAQMEHTNMPKIARVASLNTSRIKAYPYFKNPNRNGV